MAMERKLLLTTKIILMLLALLSLDGTAWAQGKKKGNKRKEAQSEAPAEKLEPKLMEGMTWRSIGPYRGGR